MTMPIATVDIGTNCTLLLVAKKVGAQVQVLAEAAEITRLGRGIGTHGRLGSDGIEKTLAVLRDYAQVAAEHGAPLFAIGTEGLRKARNSEDFLTPAAALLGKPVEVIDGQREAALTFLSATQSFPHETQGPVVVVDIGGGSTEIIVADKGEMTFRRSLPLGSVRLTESLIQHDPALPEEMIAVRNEIRSQLREVPFPSHPTTLIGTAGTVTTLAAMAQNLSSYDPARVHGYDLSFALLEAQIKRLFFAHQREREAMPGLDPRRADVILAGACILLEIAKNCQTPGFRVSDRGIRWGLFYEKLASGSDRVGT